MTNDHNSSFRLRHSSLLILISFLLPSYLIRFSVFGIPTTFLEAAIWLAFLLGALQPAVRHSWVNAWKTFSLPRVASAKWGLFFFLFSALVSTFISPDLETSAGILKGWIITPMLYAFMVYASLRHSGLVIRHYAKALILSGLIMALLGLSQIGTLGRIQGIFDVPNSLALFLAPLIILAACSPPLLLPLAKGETQEGVFSRLAAAVMFLALLLTQSLVGVLSVLIVLLLGYLVIRKLEFDWSLGIGHWSFFAAAVVLCAIILFPKIEYLKQPGSSAHVRLQLWSISWDLIKEHPLLGLGLGTFEPAYQAKLHERFKAKVGVSAPLAEFVFRDPHNWLLSFWLNLGLLGLLSFTFLNVYVLIKNKNTALKLSLITILLFGLVDTVYWKNDLATLHWLLLALAIPGIIKA